jgi:hypothetical protein
MLTLFNDFATLKALDALAQQRDLFDFRGSS